MSQDVIAVALYPLLLVVSYKVGLYHHLSVSGARGRVIVEAHLLVSEPATLLYSM